MADTVFTVLIVIGAILLLLPLRYDPVIRIREWLDKNGKDT